MIVQEMEFELRSVLFVVTQDMADTKQVLSIPDWDVHVAQGLEDAKLSLVNNRYKVGLIQLEDSSKQMLRVAEKLMTTYRSMEWIVLTNDECLQEKSFCKFISETCYDFVTLPLNDTGYTCLLSTLGHAFGMAGLKQKDSEPNYDEYEMVGSSPAMIKLFGAVRRVANVSAPVLIYGESGTGKELVARAIHERSHCANGPFVAVNCGAIPENLIQSELFGYEKGAFTGANKQKLGQIEMASGGTLFLDEVGDLPYDMQVNLLRFLQEKVIQRVGGNEEIPIDVRVISATNVDLDGAIKQGRFREDLLYRLNVLQILTPALRDRGSDIELLTNFFFEHFVSEGQGRLKGFSQQALMAIQQHRWPGNVRELINRVRRAIVMCDGRLIQPNDLGLEACTEEASLVMPLKEVRALAEKEAIANAIQNCRQNMTQAAKMLGVSRVTLYRMMDKYALAPSIEPSVEADF